MNVRPFHVLLVEDSLTDATIIRESLDFGPRPVNVTVTRSLAEARATLRDFTPCLAIVDLFLPDGRGIDLLPNGQEEIDFPTIIMTGHGDVEAAIEAMKGGAIDYVTKSPEALVAMPRTVERVLREWDHIAERKKAEQALQAANRQLQNIIEFLPDATFVTDRENRVIAWNRAMEEMTGVPKEELLGRGNYDYAFAFYKTRRPLLIDLLDKPDPEIESTYDQFKREGRTLYAEGFVPNLHNGKGAYLWIKASPLLDEQGNRTGSVESIRDLTERKQAEEELLKANRELDAFVYTVSHDLRSPLTPIIGFADLLIDNAQDRLSANDVECLENISRSGKRMITLMEDLLALARVGQVEFPDDPVDSGAVVNEVVSSLAGQLVQAGVSVNLDSLPSLRIPKSLLVQVFDNLIGNAFRYGCKPGDVIEVGGERKGDKVRFFVRDHGPGIPDAERDRIFEVFYRGMTGKAKDGTGIGLATVRKIARLFGGQAWIDETPGGGSTFRVELVDAPSAPSGH
ncbi:MAG: hypothetical protein C0616_07410 [Desulfuromonas sp.]|nr:MAG: hypothetical protein C0616_07410 [Desulfuromonas sp.]